MKVLTSRVVVSAIASFVAFAIVPAIATTPEADFKTVTSKAYVDSLISNNDISGHKVNGVALSNANITLYGRSSTGATTAAKAVKVYNSAEGDVTIGALSTGMVIVVKPTYTATTTAPTTLNVNSLGAKPMRYNGAAITVADAAKVWNKDNPSIWVYDGTNWNFAGGGKGADNLVWGTSETTSTNAYDTTFVGDTGATANAWPAADKTKIVDTSALANALALKQNKIDAQNTSLIPGQQVINGVPSSVIAPTDAPGVVQQVALWDADGGDSASWDLESAYGVTTERAMVRQSIPTVGAVETGLALKQNKIPVGTTPNNLYTNGSVLTYTNSAGTVGEKYIIGSNIFIDLVDGIENWTNDYQNMLVNAGDIGLMLQRLDWSSTQSAAINAYETTFGTGTNNWAGNSGNLVNGYFLANSLALKQNKIPAGTAGEILTYSGTAGQLGTPWVVLSNLFGEDGDAIENYSTTFDGTDGNWLTSSANKLITTNVLADVLVLKQNKLPAAWTSTTGTINLASTGGQTIDLTATEGNVGRRYITAGGSQPLTKKSGADNVILYINGTKTLAQYQTSNFGGTGTINQNYIKGALVSLELLKDVYGELNSKITNNALPTGTAGTVVTYNGTNPQTGVQQFTETAIADAPDYTGTGGSLVNGDSITSVEYVEDALAAKQPIIQPSTVNGKTQIVVKPAYGGNAGEIGYLTLDTSSLTTGNDSTVPSSKLLNTLLGGKYDTDYILDTGETDIYASDYSGAPSWATTSGTANLYRFPGAVNGDNWASKVLYAWSSKQNVPTMDTLANSLAGLYDAVGDLVDNQILDYGETGSNLLSASVPVPTQIEYAGAQFLGDGNQLFWLPQLASNGVQEATQLLKYYSNNKIVPSMDELAYALDGVLQTHETAEEWQAVASAYHVGDIPLFMIRDKRETDANVRSFYGSGYLQTFAPTLDALAEESFTLYKLIDTKQDKLSGTSGNLVTYGTTAGSTGSKAIATSISNNANTVPNTQAVYNAVNARQNVIPVAGKYRSSNTATTDTTISDWTATNIKGTALVTKPTSSNGVVGERKIFEAGTTYTNDAATNIQIATIGAVMENTVTKRCVGYKPGTTGETAANCWLWEFVSNSADSGRCIAAGGRCSNSSDCCSRNCVNGVCSAVGVNEDNTEFGGDKSNP